MVPSLIKGPCLILFWGWTRVFYYINNKMKEKNTQVEFLKKVEVDKKVKEIEFLGNLVLKSDLFADDNNDEFQVILPNGEMVGIFKTWAVPAIPLIESGVADGWKTVENWSKKMKTEPVKAWENLERWRGFAENNDRRLYKVFSEIELPTDKRERIAELYTRLKIAFGYASPFYHIEAMVGDGNNTQGNPFAGIDKGVSGGFLDMVGMLLPSALEDRLTAEKLNWKGLSWKELQQKVETEADVKKLSVLLRVARAAGIKTEEVLFAANVLEWIPVSVGGKKGDLFSEEATSQLLQISGSSSELDLDRVARDMNGLIRFLNWTPLVRGQNNFSETAGWKYSAVCETANLLIKELSDGKQMRANISSDFVEFVLPQLTNLDASSARGRFVLWMLENNWLDRNLEIKIRSGEKKIVREIAIRMVEAENEDEVIDLGASNSRQLVGGKAAGLYEASVIFGKEFVDNGAVVTTEAIDRWLKSDSALFDLIKDLESSTSIQRKLSIGEEIRKRILNKKFPEAIVEKIRQKVSSELVAVRSSSFDEDTLVNGSAAGIYESEVPVLREHIGDGLVSVVSSFFSEKAISYRHLHKLSDIPMFAGLVHDYVDGRGGVVFSGGNSSDWSVFTGATPGHIVSGDSQFDSIEKRGSRIQTSLKNGWVEAETVNLLGEMSVLGEEVLGGKADIEFVVGIEGIKILQLRMLNEKSEATKRKIEKPKRWFNLTETKNLADVTIDGSDPVGLIVDSSMNIEQFQGELFRCLVRNKNRITEVNLPKKIPGTSHFANICLNLGIKLVFRDE